MLLKIYSLLLRNTEKLLDLRDFVVFYFVFVMFDPPSGFTGRGMYPNLPANFYMPQECYALSSFSLAFYFIFSSQQSAYCIELDHGD